ncbi:MAG: hypothetical protein CM1200mP2_56720 [Planctomycetaceae bacterium]|nr:MAG: hypothetical protein CM1200mP2_56720 [Planctomycetaceae bacterium]
MGLRKGGPKGGTRGQKAGKVRFIGFTGTRIPAFPLEMLGQPYKWATAQMPINICDYFYRSFQKNVVPACLKNGVGVIGMKTLAGSPDGKNGAIPAAGPGHRGRVHPLFALATGLLAGRRHPHPPDLDQA